MNAVTTLVTGLLVLSTLGCSSVRRSVTHVRIEKDNAYVAYAEWKDGGFTFITGSDDHSRVKNCKIQPDNSATCEEDADINAILNPQDGAPPPAAKKKAPPAAVEAPEEAAPEEAEPSAADGSPAQS